jgi:Flp pilus assembly protein TadD
MTMSETSQDLLQDLDGFDLRSLGQEGAGPSVDVDTIVALARGKLSYREALRVTPESMQRVAEYAFRLVQREQYDAAGFIFDALVALDPKVPYFHLGLATALANCSERAAALTELEAARKLDPMDVTAYVNAAQILLEESRKDEARRLLEQAQKLDPRGLQPLSALGKRLWIAHFMPA